MSALIWTPERIAELQRLWGRGLSVREIADRMLTTVTAIHSAMNNLRCKGVVLPLRGRAGVRTRCRDHDDEIVALRHAGLTSREIAARVGMTKQAVVSAITCLRRDGVVFPDRRGVNGSRASRSGADSKPAPAAPSARPALRRCLGCGRMFPSAGPGNRLCGECRPQATALQHMEGISA